MWKIDGARWLEEVVEVTSSWCNRMDKNSTHRKIHISCWYQFFRLDQLFSCESKASWNLKKKIKKDTGLMKFLLSLILFICVLIIGVISFSSKFPGFVSLSRVK